jgi:hypothetical protein
MRCIFKSGQIEIWQVGGDFYVYGVRDSGDPVVCPSEGMAREVAACAS